MGYLSRTLYSAAGLLVVGGGLATFAYLGPLKEKVTTAEKRVEEARLFTFAPGQVIGGELHAKGAELRFARVGSTWRIQAPVDAPAEQALLDKLIVTVASVVSDAKLEGASASDVETLRSFGLAEPRVRVALDLGGGQKAELAVGEKNEFDGRLYVENVGTKRLGLADASLLGALDRDLYALRDKRLFTFETREVTRVETKRGAEVLYQLERAGEDWRLSGKDARAADTLEAVRVVESLRMLRAAAFVDDSGTGDAAFLAKWGLEPPAFRVALGLEGGKTLELRVGTARDDLGRPRWYARVEGERALVEVHETFYKDLERTSLDLQDKGVLAFVEGDVEAIELQLPGETRATLEKKGGAWTIAAPKPGPARAEKVGALLYALRHLRAKRFDTNGATKADLERTGLAKSAGQVKLLGAGGKVLATLRLGAEVSAEPGARFVLAEGSGRIDVVDAAKLALPTRVDELAAP